jgi:hypothetical protein
MADEMVNDSAPMEQAPVETTESTQGPEIQDTQQEAPFFEAEDEKGKKYTWKTRDEFAEAWKQSGMLRSDYSRKTMSLAEERKKWEQEREQQMSELMKNRERYDKFNSFLKQNPHIFQKLEAEMKKGNTPDAVEARVQQILEEKTKDLSERLSKYEEAEKQRERERLENAAYERITKKYPDFDREKVKQLQEGYDGQYETLLDLLYHANRSMSGSVMEKQAERQEQKREAKLVPGGRASAQSPPKFASLEEAHAQALRDLN